METMYNHLLAIEKRSALYNVYTARDIFHFTNGYELAIVTNKINDPTVPHFHRFSEWLRGKNLGKYNWLGIIEVNSTPVFSLHSFFTWFDEYLEENPIEV